MQTLLAVIHVVTCLLLILVILLQSGRGGGLGAGMQGAGGQIFGGRGANTFLTRFTTGAATVFFITSLSLSYLSSHHHSVIDQLQQEEEAPEEADKAQEPNAPKAQKP